MQAAATAKGATGMSTRGQSIAAAIQPSTASRVYPTCAPKDATRASLGRVRSPRHGGRQPDRALLSSVISLQLRHVLLPFLPPPSVARTLRQIMPDEADRRILALALEHHLVTRLTSLVAVDRTPSRPDGALLTRAEVPLNLPAGWDFDKVFGGERAPAPVPAERRADADPARDVQLAYAAVSRVPKPVATKPLAPVGQGGVTLPKTATDAELRLWLGLLLCSVSLILLVLRRRQRDVRTLIP
jgi:LPXTG-motif cell wall-anchored protein